MGMACLKTLDQIRSQVPKLQDSVAAPRLLKVLLAGGRITRKEVLKIWPDFRSVFGRSDASPHQIIRDACTSSNTTPPDSWITSVQRLVKQRDLKSPVFGAFGGACDRALDEFSRIMHGLPATFRRKLGFDWPSPPWFFRLSVEQSCDLSELRDNDRVWIQKNGGTEKFAHFIHRWSQLKRYISDSAWVVEWPNLPAFLHKIEVAAGQFESSGRLDFSLTIEEVTDAILETVKAGHDETPWLPIGEGGIAPNIQVALNAGALLPPIDLEPNRLKNAVKSYLEPPVLSETLYSKAFLRLLDPGGICLRKIHSTQGGNAQPNSLDYVCLTADSQRDGQDDSSAPMSRRKSAAKAPPTSQEIPWNESAEAFITGKEAIAIADGKIAPTKLSKTCRPDGPIRYMRKGQRLRVHVGDFREWLRSANSAEDFDRVDAYVAGVEERKSRARQDEPPSK